MVPITMFIKSYEWLLFFVFFGEKIDFFFVVIVSKKKKWKIWIVELQQYFWLCRWYLIFVTEFFHLWKFNEISLSVTRSQNIYHKTTQFNRNIVMVQIIKSIYVQHCEWEKGREREREYDFQQFYVCNVLCAWFHVCDANYRYRFGSMNLPLVFLLKAFGCFVCVSSLSVYKRKMFVM